jgi:hypothetical protein
MFVARKRDQCSLIENRLVFPHDTIPSTFSGKKMTMTKKIEKWINNYSGIVAFIFVIIGFSIIVFFLFSTPFNDWSFDRNSTLFSQYGDFIGGFIGTIFSLAGFFLIYKTLTTQQETLKQQETVSRRDRFEVTFFNLLKTQNEITNSLKAYFYNLKGDTAEISNIVSGRDFFIYSKRELKNIWSSLSSNVYLGLYDRETAFWAQQEIDEFYNPESSNFMSPEDAKEKENKILYEIKLSQINKFYGITKSVWDSGISMNIPDKLSLAYGLFFQKYHYVAGHYFRHLYHILDFAQINKLEQMAFVTDLKLKQEIEKDFNKYVSFVQAQMSSYELLLLFYNALSFPKMLFLIKTFNFLENLTIEDLIDESHDCIEGINLKSRKDLM